MEKTLTDTITEHALGKPHQVVLFNDDHHDMMEVVLQIVRAISCSQDHAWKIMLEAHSTGRAVVVVAHKERCEHVSAVLEEIRLGTKVEPV
jgi:ATP-dependent Clp protease adapter protein ClpS